MLRAETPTLPSRLPRNRLRGGEAWRAPQTAQRLMRHGDYRVTLKHYTDPRLLDTAAALAALPSIDPAPAPERLRATGTTDAAASGQKRRRRWASSLAERAARRFKTGQWAAILRDAAMIGQVDVTSEVTQDSATACDAVQESGRPGSNRQQPAWKAGTLPIELRPRREGILAGCGWHRQRRCGGALPESGLLDRSDPTRLSCRRSGCPDVVTALQVFGIERSEV